MKHQTEISRDKENKKLNVTREFNAPVDKVWAAWTDSSILDKWWAPKPWRAETKTMDFKPGGLWLYSMVGPEGEKHWSRADFKTVAPKQSFSSESNFCDEEGNPNPAFSPMYWLVEFKPSAAGTKIEVELSFADEVGMETIIAMGFEGGFSMGLNNLDELLASQ